MCNGTNESTTHPKIPTGTLYYEVSRDKRANARANAKRRTRGRAAPDKQLGSAQRRILSWLLTHHQHAEHDASEVDRDKYRRLGVEWAGAAEQLGMSSKVASTALRGTAGRSLLDRRLVEVRLSSGVWRRSPPLTAADRVVGVRLSEAGMVAARLVDPVTKEDIRPIVERNVTALYETKYGPIETWSAATHAACQRQIEDAIAGRQVVTQLLGVRLQRLSAEEAFTLLTSYPSKPGKRR